MSQPEVISLPSLYPMLSGAGWIHDEDGYIVWRWGTGDNVEITHIRSSHEGGGPRLIRKFLEKIKDRPPYCTVFGFTRSENHRAKAFYLRCGFSLSDVTGVYADGQATLFSADFMVLCKLHNVNNDPPAPKE